MSAVPLILIVEDEAVTSAMLASLFAAEGYHVIESRNGDEMHAALQCHRVDVVVMDINLPGKNGLLLARELKQHAQLGLIFLTGRQDDVDRILGLEIGADDYITKPFNPRELSIRVRNLLQRLNAQRQQATPYALAEPSATHYNFADWSLDVEARTLFDPIGQGFKLPRYEFRTLLYFCLHPQKLIQRGELYEYIAGKPLRPKDRTIDVTIRRIRCYFEQHQATPELIKTMHGEGYRFTATVSDLCQ